jgi:hypothetical protein
MTSFRGTLGALGLVLGLVLSATACGIPTGEAPETIAPSDIPYGLTSTTPTRTSETSPPPLSDDPRIYLVAADDVLVPRGRAVEGGTAEERLNRLVDELAAGPSSAELGEQLSTALPPDVRLSVTAIEEDTAVIDLTGSENAPSGLESRRAVGQVVLSATSVPGIGAILLTRDGVPVEPPLPSGELTSAPLTAEDYAALLTSPPP